MAPYRWKLNDIRRRRKLGIDRRQNPSLVQHPARTEGYEGGGSVVNTEATTTAA